MGLTSLEHAYRLEGPVELVSGKIDNSYMTHSRRGGTSYYISYSYWVGDMWFEAKGVHISYEDSEVLRVGDDLMIRYVPDAPTISEPNTGDEPGFAIKNGWLQTLLPLLFVGAGFYAGLFAPKGDKPRFGDNP